MRHFGGDSRGTSAAACTPFRAATPVPAASLPRIDGATLTVILSALGLSGATGLNAWLPLLLTAGLQRVGWVDLDPAWAQLGDTPVLLALGALFVLDFVGDKVPIVDHALHAAGIIVHPAAGTVLFDAQAGSDVSLLVSLVLGGGSAGLLHTARATARPAVSGATAGIGAPVMSALEDLAAVLLVIVAFLIPVVAGVVVIALIVGALLAARHVRSLLRDRSRARADRGDRTGGPGGAGGPAAPPRNG